MNSKGLLDLPPQMMAVVKKFNLYIKEDGMNRMIGVLAEKVAKATAAGKPYTVVKVNGVSMSAWDAIQSALAGVNVGQNVEVVYETNAKGFNSLREIAIQGDGVPATPAPVSVAPAGGKSYGKTPYGKSPEERLSITAQAAAHDATPIIVEWVKVCLATDPNWLTDNWENVAKAHTNLMAVLADGIMDYCASHKEN